MKCIFCNLSFDMHLKKWKTILRLNLDHPYFYPFLNSYGPLVDSLDHMSIFKPAGGSSNVCYCQVLQNAQTLFNRSRRLRSKIYIEADEENNEIYVL